MRRLWSARLLLPAANAQPPVNGRPFKLEELHTQQGFAVSIYAHVNGGPRHMAFGPDGILYVAARGSGNVVAIPRSNQTTTVLTGLTGPHSLAFARTYPYVSTDNAVWRFPSRGHQIVK